MNEDEFLYKIGLFKYYHKYNNLIASGDEEALETCMNNYVNYLCLLFDDYSIELVYAAIDYIRCYERELFEKLLEKNNDKVMRAFVIMKKIYGTDPIALKNNYTEVINKLVENVTARGFDDSRKKLVFDRELKEFQLLYKYLEKIDNKKIEETMNQDLLSFYHGLHNIDEVLFANSSDSENDKATIIDYLFKYSKIDMSTLNRIYQEVLTKNEALVSYNFNSIINFNSKYIRNIKGLYLKCGEEFFDWLAQGLLVNHEKLKELCQTLEDVVRLNSDDEIGLTYFFTRLNMHITKKTRKYLEQFDFYKQYANADIKKVYEQALKKIINKDLSVNKSIIESIGLYEGFLEKYDFFLDLYCKSGEEEYLDLLSLPLAVGLIEKLRRKDNLDYRIVLCSKQLDNNTLGSYNHFHNILYVNPYVLNLFYDKKQAFAKGVDTIFHEVRHAKQFKILKNDNSINFSNLLMSMDSILSKILPRYNTINYYIISYEYDARSTSQKEAKQFFGKYHDMQEKIDDVLEMRKPPKNIQNLLKRHSEENIDNLIVRIDPKMDNQSECGIYDLFIRYSNEWIKEKGLKQFIDMVKSNYPILLNFFDIDHRNKLITSLKDHSLVKLMKKIEKIKNIKEKEEALYTMKMFVNMRKMPNYTDNIREDNYLNRKY